MKLLRFIYRGFMTGMPFVVYNPYRDINFHAPFSIAPNSLYINYKLTEYEKNTIEQEINSYGEDFTIMPIKMKYDEDPDYYLSLNIYNCTSPLFLNDDGMTRFEINTYVNNGKQNGTIIIDYLSNALSMDPVNIFKDRSSILYSKDTIVGSDYKNISINCSLNIKIEEKPFKIGDDLVYFSDNIFYKNGIYDKLFYDTSLINAEYKFPGIRFINFTFMSLNFTRPDSVFYFKNKINFAGSMWHNLHFNGKRSEFKPFDKK